MKHAIHSELGYCQSNITGLSVRDMAGFGFWAVCVIVAGIAMAFFLNCPAPQMSDTLQEWKGRGNYFTFKTHKIFYRDDSGSAEDGSVLVCLHGFPTFSYDWSKMWEKLTMRYSRVIAADFIGFGFSDKPLEFDYKISIQADIIESLLKELNVTRAHVIAHDYGDTVAQELLYRYETSKEQKQDGGLVIETMCLLNGGIFPETNHPRIIQKLLLEPWLAPILKRLTTFGLFKRGFGEIFGPQTQPTPDEMSDFFSAMLWNEGYLVSDRVLQFIPQRKHFRERWVGALERATIPLHVIYGSADPVNPPAFIKHFKGIVPRAGITVLDGIGHYPQWEDADATTRAYFTFLVMPSKQ